MIAFTSKLYEDMEHELGKVATATDDEMAMANDCYQVVGKTMEKLKSFITNHPFKSRGEEINFFKNVKPKFQSQLIYYAELIYIGTEKPVGDRKNLIVYLKMVIDNNLRFIERNKFLYQYHKVGRDSEDDLLFLRETDCTPFYPEYKGDMDTNFSTVNSSILSKLLAFEMVNEKLVKDIEQLRLPSSHHPQATEQHPKLVWTDSKTDFVEFVYGLNAKGSLNHGNASVKQIMDVLQDILHIKVENYYRIYTDITLRKKSRTTYTDSMKEYLERRMDDAL